MCPTDGKHFKEDWLIVSVLFTVMALKIFVPLLKKVLLLASVLNRDATIHNLDVSIYCHLCITILQYIARYNQV